ncbi:MAG: hypothetical protein QG577_2689 [Thermodesulfobacteriota bacterium]|nr:hypothetical protein [Thermodesulfobacteriota bacterium]
MAYVIFFSRDTDFQAARDYFPATTNYSEVLEVPKFCQGLALPSLLVSGTKEGLLSELAELGVKPCGLIRHQSGKKDIRLGSTPNEAWRAILGETNLRIMRQSVSDPQKLHGEILAEKNFGYLIPLMACLIKGGAYRPEIPSLALEEGHRLIAFSPQEIFISRASDVLDFWINLRRCVDLICEAQEKRSFLSPVTEPRQGISAIEIFRRLPSTNCGQCGKANCMEFAVAVCTGKGELEDCTPLRDEPWSEHKTSALWLLRTIGVG